MTSSNNYRPYIRYLFIAFLLFLIFPPFFYHPTGRGLDASYIIAIHLAFKYHLVFGKDIVFTFGPLGILNDRFPIAVLRLVYLLFDLYFLLTTGMILCEIIKKSAVYARLLYIFICFLLALYEPPFQWYFLFFLFYLLRQKTIRNENRRDEQQASFHGRKLSPENRYRRIKETSRDSVFTLTILCSISVAI